MYSMNFFINRYATPVYMSIGYPLYRMSNIDCVCHCRCEYIYLVTLKTPKAKNRKCLQKMYDSYNRTLGKC